MTKETITKKRFQKLSSQEEKIISLLKEERSIVQRKFPLMVAFLAFFGFVVTWSGLIRIINQINWLNNNPILMVAVGLSILVITGAAYRKLG